MLADPARAEAGRSRNYYAKIVAASIRAAPKDGIITLLTFGVVGRDWHSVVARGVNRELNLVLVAPARRSLGRIQPRTTAGTNLGLARAAILHFQDGPP